LAANMIRIFIGCSGNDEDLEFQAVVHYSLQRHTSEPLDITWMRLSRDPQSFWYSDPQANKGWCTKSWATPFSALRWGIPAACNFEGKAIYMDLDMIARADIAELWNEDIPNGYAMVSKPEAICVTLYDCAKMKQLLPAIEDIKRKPGFYREVRNRITNNHRTAIKRYKGNWNCLDMRRDAGGEYTDINDPDIKVLHFTAIPTQPHLPRASARLAQEGRRHWYPHPTKQHHRKDALKLFDQTFEEAMQNGFTLDKYRNPTPFGDYGR
jgi:hypothetical protein